MRFISTVHRRTGLPLTPTFYLDHLGEGPEISLLPTLPVSTYHQRSCLKGNKDDNLKVLEEKLQINKVNTRFIQTLEIVSKGV